MFDFRRITLFCQEKTPLKTQNDCIFYKFGGGMASLPPWLRLWIKPCQCVISIAIMLRIVGSTLFLVGAGRRCIVTATNGSQRDRGYNRMLKVILSF